MNKLEHVLQQKKSASPAMFDEICSNYDRVNRWISLGLHHLWRRRVVNLLPPRAGLRVLDLATGTGDLAFCLARPASVTAVVGLDLSQGMLAIAKQKTATEDPRRICHFVVGDAGHLQSSLGQFDFCSMAFGIRNCPDHRQVLRQAYDRLKTDSTFAILEFGLPPSKIWRALHLFYLKMIVPTLGRWMSGHSTAYAYLNETIQSFPYGERFAKDLRQAGFVDVAATPLLGGIVWLYSGVRK